LIEQQQEDPNLAHLLTQAMTEAEASGVHVCFHYKFGEKVASTCWTP